MKKFILFLFFPLFLFSQETIIVGDVDCNGELNSNDASLILQFVTNVIDSLPCEVNMVGLTPEQLEEMINLMEDQLSINYTGGSVVDFLYPQGYNGDPVTQEFDEVATYLVPDGQTLYITEIYVPDDNVIVQINDKWIGSYYFSSGHPSNFPLILESGDVLSTNSSTNTGVFNGILIQSSQLISPITQEFNEVNTYIVPDNKNLYITEIHAADDNVTVQINNNWIGAFYFSSSHPSNFPLILESGDVLSTNSSTNNTVFNGYLADDEFFASAITELETDSEDGLINYFGGNFGDWVLKYDNPDFDNFLYGQEETDGFLLIQYSRDNQMNSSSSFGFNIHTGSDIDTTDFNMDVSINVKNSWNPINSKTIPIKKGDYWILENIDDVFSADISIDKVYFLTMNGEASINETNSGDSNTQIVSNKNMMFPDGFGGEPISWSLTENDDYTVPVGKNLYITQYHNTDQSNGLFIIDLLSEENQIIKGHSNYIFYTGVGFSPSNTNGMPIVVGPEQIVSGDGNFTGFLKDAIINPVTIEIDGVDWDNWSGDSYEVPEDKIFYILQFYGEDSSALLIDGVAIVENYSNNIFYTGVGFTPALTLSVPILVGPGQVITGSGSINGYLADINYFSQ